MERVVNEEPTLLSLEDWIERQTFRSTRDISIPDKISDRIIGQDRAVEVMKKAASQKKHVIIIGEPGTEKSMLANSMVEYLPKEGLQDIVSYHNPEDVKNQKNSLYMYACVGLLMIGLIGMLLFGNWYILMISLFGIMIILMFTRMPNWRQETAVAPNVLVGHDSNYVFPFVDAMGADAGSLFGDVRNDPFQSSGLDDSFESGAIRKANKGVLYIDEINLLSMESQQALLTAMREKKIPITGRSEEFSGSLVKFEPMPYNFVLVCAGNLDAIKGMHPALRSTIRDCGYEVYMRNTMPDTEDNRYSIARFVAQEVTKDKKIPHFDKYAVGEIIKEAQHHAGRNGELTLRMRELGDLVRASGNLAIERGADIVTTDDVNDARRNGHQQTRAW